MRSKRAYDRILENAKACQYDKVRVGRFAYQLPEEGVYREHCARMKSGKPCDENEVKQILSDFVREELCHMTLEDAIETVAVLSEDYLKRAPTPRTRIISIGHDAESEIVIGTTSTSAVNQNLNLRGHMDYLAEKAGEFDKYVETRAQKGSDVPLKTYAQLSKSDEDEGTGHNKGNTSRPHTLISTEENSGQKSFFQR